MLSQFLQFLFSGVTVGATYALAALGFTLIYNASNVINFAQGEFIMLGGMLAAYLGTMIFLIAAMDNPFRGEVSVSAEPFEALYKHMVSE